MRPTLAESGKFVATARSTGWGRLQSEMRTEFKKSAMDKGSRGLEWLRSKMLSSFHACRCESSKVRCFVG